VINSYEETPYYQSLQLQQEAYVASNGVVTNPTTLAGLHNLGELSENDQRILGVCQAN
jgi:hypothetical protein